MSSSLEHVRNLGIIAHIDAGKTTLSERVLVFSGRERRMGEVHHGSTVLDWMPEERRRGITITAATTSVTWGVCSVNLIDTPGHVDFTVEVERCLRVLDGAVLVISAVAGVQAQSETVWRHARRYGVTTITFVNQCDRPGADFLSSVAEIERRLEVRAVPIHYPLGEGEDFRGFVDVIELRAFLMRGSEEVLLDEVPESVRDEAAVLRSDLVDALVELDEELLEHVIEVGEAEPEALRRSLRRATLRGELQPVLLGSALLGSGVRALLDGVVAYLPSPLDRAAIGVTSPDGERTRMLTSDPEGPLAALVFKVQELERRELAFLRVFSGSLLVGKEVTLPRQEERCRIEELLRLHADSTEAVERAVAGDIVAWPMPVQALTGDTLTEVDSPWVIERPVFSDPVLRRVLEPLREVDREALSSALERIAREDPSLRVGVDRDTGQWQLGGMGELHLEVVVKRLADEFGLEVRSGAPSVAFREAVLTTGRGEGRLGLPPGASPMGGHLTVELAPDPDSGRFSVEWAVDPPRSPLLRDGIERELERVAQVGPRFGFPLVHARARLLAFQSQSGEEVELAFAQAAAIALREAMVGASFELLEPVTEIVIRVPEAVAPGVAGDLAARRARVLEQETEGRQRRIRARLPLARLAGYATDLRSLSQGRATFEQEPAGFQLVPDDELAERGLIWV